MGCCLSKTEQSFKPYPSQAPPPPPPPPPQTQPPLPPPLPRSPPVEEETVKEVLSETPTTKPPSIPKIDEEMEMRSTPSPPKIEEEKKIPVVAAPVKEPEPEPEPEISEGMSSEICTLSETISTNTMTTQDKNELEDGEVVQQPRLHRSPVKFPRKRSFPGDSTGIHQRGSKSPARRSDPSPGRRNDNALKSAYCSDLSQTQTQSSRRRVSDSNINHTNRIRRDSGECSGRRSRSPATRVSSGGSRTGVGRSPSRRSGRSPARAPPLVSPEKIQKPEAKPEEETKEAEEGTNPTTNESMENPLVSLECFIFL